ncbi:hypothetical protein ACROYT_G027964 [Oculina patagonica]
MKTFILVVLLSGLFTLRSESHPSHRKSPKHIAPWRSNSTINHVEAGQKRAFPAILAAFTVFSNIADFMGQANNVVGWFDNINRFMGSGGTEGADQVTPEHLDEIKRQIENVADEVKSGIQDLLAGSEYTQILVVLSDEINTLRVIDHLQKEYLEATKNYKENPNENLMRERRQKWFDDIDERFVQLKTALISLLLNICDPILNTYDLFEGYAWKKGEQGTGTLVDLMHFITKIRMLQTNGYGVWKSHLYKKFEDNEDRRTVELNVFEKRMKDVAECEDPAIAKAFTRMIDHQGTPAYGRIRWSHTYDNVTSNPFGQNEVRTYDRCLTNLGPAQTTPFARACSDGTNQQWKLNPDNTLRPKSNPNKCLFLIEPDEDLPTSGFKVLPCSSSYRNKKFKFEYLTHQKEGEPKLHTFFKLKVKNENFVTWRGHSICLAYRPTGGYTGPSFTDWSPSLFSCSCPSGEGVFHCIGENPPTSEFGWFKFEPTSE